MSNILTGFNMQGNDPIDDRIVSKSNLETLEQYLNRVPVQKRYYGLTFFALDKNNELRKYTFQTSLINPTIDDNEEEIERIDKELQEHVSDKSIHKTSEEIRSEIVDADIPDTISRVQWTLDQINTAVINLIGGASDEYNTLKRIQTKIEELRAKIYGDDGGTVLKTLEQALKFLNQYKDFIVDIPENFVNKQDIVDNLTTDDPTKVLSAKQGKVLSDTLTNYFESAMQSIRTETDRAINAENRIETKLDKEIDRSIKEDQRIDAKLDAEIKRSTDEDLRIDSKLDSEINRSTTEDDRLDKKIDAETTRATDAESNLNTKIETETDRAESEESRIETKLDNEIARSTNKDTEHDNRLTELEGDTHEQNTDLGTTNSTFQLKYNTGNKIKHESDAISVRNAADTDYVNFIAKNATFKGDLLVEGQSFVTEAETVEIKDNLLLLNKGEVGAGVTKGIAGLEIDRGTEPNYQIIFDESDNRFKAGEIGDIQCLALRDGDNSMVNGMFTSWDSSTKRLKTTNIVPSDQKLSFGDNGDIELKYSLSKMGEIFSSAIPILNIGRKSSGYPHIEFGLSSNQAVVYTDALNGIYLQNQVLGRTFKRATDLSEVLYHADIVNDLTSGGTNKVLSAEQGKLLQNSITSIQGSYLPLTGGNMKGNIVFNNNLFLNWKDTKGSAYQVLSMKSNDEINIGNTAFPLNLYSKADLFHKRNGESTYKIWDAYNLPTPASTTDLANYLPLIGGTLTGQLTIKQSVDIKLGLQSTDADNHCIIQAINAQASQLGVFGYAGDKWAIGHGGTYYEIWDKYNLTNPVTYTTNTYNHATLTNKDGQYFTYIKAGTNGLLPHSKATLVSGGSGSLGTSDQSFNAAYINNLHTNKVTFGDAGSFIDNQSGDSDHIGIGFYTSQNAACPVYVGSLCVSDSYANGAPYIPTNGIYSKGNIRTNGWLTFEDNEWTDTGWTYKDAKGSIKVLSVINETKNKPTSYGSVLQFNSRQGHWCTQIWCDQTNTAGVIGTLRFRTTISYASTKWNPWTALVTTSDLGNYLPLKGGTLSGQLIVGYAGSTPLIVNNSYTNGVDSILNFRVKGVNKTLVGYSNGNGPFIQDASNNRCIMVKSDGAYFGTELGAGTKLALITDIPTVSGYLPLSGGIVTGDIKLNTEAALYTAASSGSGYSYYKTISYDNDKGIILGASNTSIKIQSSDSRIYHIYKGTEYEIYSTNSLPTPVFAPGKVAGSLTPIYNNSFYINDYSYRVATIDNSYSFPKIYSPTSAGTSGQILQSTGGVPEWVNASSVVGNFVSKSGDTMTGALTMNRRSLGVVIDVIGGAGNSWNEGAGALSVQVSNDAGQTPLLLARRSGAAIDTTTAAERLLSMELLDDGHSFIIGMSGSKALQLDWTSGKAGTGKLFGKTIATTDQIPSIPSISISNSGSGNAVTSITASGHTLTVTKGATYLTSHQTIYNLTFQAGTFSAKTFDPNGAAATVNIPTKTSHITNDSGFITSSALSGYATQSWANGQFAPLSRFNTSTGYTTIKVSRQELNFDSADPEIYMNFRTLSGSTAVTKITWRAGGGANSTALCEGRWGDLYMNNNLVATQTWSNSQYPLKTGTGASGTWGISISGNATTASTASKLGSTTIGGSAKPIYLSSGTPTACSATVGSTTVPVYMNAGTITQCSTTLGVSITGNAATATNATQLGGTAASSYVKANDNISRLTNDRNYVRSTSTLKVADIQVLDGGTPGSEAGILYIVLE